MKNKPRLFYPILSFFLSIIIWILFLAVYNTLGHGNYTIIRGDLYAQYIDFISMFLRVLKGEESLWYSFSIYLGSGTILTHAYYCFTPFNLLYLLDFISIPAMTTVIIGLKFALAASTFTVFANKVLKQNGFSVCMFALFYAFNSFSISFYFNMIWLDALYMLPILVWLLFELVDNGRYLMLTFCWLYLFITNFYMAYTLGIFGLLVFFALLILRTEHFDRSVFRRYLTGSIRFAASVLLAAGLSAAILLPSAIYILSHLATDNFEFNELKCSLFDIINAMFIGTMPHQDNTTPLLYCGIPTLLLLPFYFTCKRFSLKERLLSASLLLFFILGTIYLPLFIALHAFDYPNWYSFRFTYIMAFINCALCCRLLVSSGSISQKCLFFYASGLILFYSFMMRFWPLSADSVDVTSGPLEFAVNIIFLVFRGCYFSRISKRKNSEKKHIFYISIGLVFLIAEIVLNSWICMKHTARKPLSESEFNQWYYSEKAVIDQIKAEDNGFYRISSVNERSNNAPSLFGYAGFNTFSTSDVFDLRNALHHLGICTVNRAIEEIGYTPITYMLLGRKYTITLSPYSAETKTVTKETYIPATIQKEDYALPLGFMVSNNINSYVPGNNPFNNQEELLRCMTGQEWSFFEPLSIDRLEQVQRNMRLDQIGDRYAFTRKTFLIPTAFYLFSYKQPYGKTLYGCFSYETPEARSSSAVIIADHQGLSDDMVLSYGCIHSGINLPEQYPQDYTSIGVYFTNPSQVSEYCDGMYFALYDNKQLPKIYNDLNQYSWNITSGTGTLIKGNVVATESRSTLFTTIPYENGWSATVDGMPTPLSATLENAFLSLELTPGPHDIELRYTAPGSHSGKWISIASLFLLLVKIIAHSKHKRLR